MSNNLNSNICKKHCARQSVQVERDWYRRSAETAEQAESRRAADHSRSQCCRNAETPEETAGQRSTQCVSYVSAVLKPLSKLMLEQLDGLQTVADHTIIAHKYLALLKRH